MKNCMSIFTLMRNLIAKINLKHNIVNFYLQFHLKNKTLRSCVKMLNKNKNY